MRLLLLGICLVAIVGCDSSLEVRGKVNFDGKPVENGVINFEPEDKNGPSKGTTITNGTYHLTGPNRIVAGSKVVRIEAFGPSGKKISSAPGSTTMVDEFKQYLPSQYNTATTLKVTVEAGKENTFDFELKR